MKTYINRSLSGRRQQLFRLLLMSVTVTSAFVSPSVVLQHGTITTPIIPPQGRDGKSNVASPSRTWQLHVVIPGVDIALMDAAIAVVSAAAGAASQLPRIQQLEKDLDLARCALTQVCYLLWGSYIYLHVFVMLSSIIIVADL